MNDNTYLETNKEYVYRWDRMGNLKNEVMKFSVWDPIGVKAV